MCVMRTLIKKRSLHIYHESPDTEQATMSVPNNSKCLVTGASDPKSIGYACAKVLIEAGAAQVCILARGKNEVDSAIASLGQDAKVHGIVGDLKKPETMASIIAQAVEKMGGK
jgi:NAD(P)-dependent dehydrogenase (short-subunit alcohol dehydrogenase family)